MQAAKYELEPADEEIEAQLSSIAASPGLRPADPRYVKFYLRSKQHREKSKAEGRSIFEAIEYVEILCPGDKDTIVDRPVRPIDKYVWSEKYVSFRNNVESGQDGTPLAVWGSIPQERVEELAYFKVRTVEQLADIPDSALHKLGLGARAEREKAKAFLLAMAGNAPLAAMQAANDSMRAENDAMKLRLEALEKLATQGAAPAEMDAAPIAIDGQDESNAPAPRKRGRPAKEKAA